MAEHDARHGLVLHVSQRIPLDRGEVADLGLREFDVGALARADAGVAGVDGRPIKAERFRRPPVKAFRVFAHGGVPARFDLGQNVLDRLPYLGVGIRLGVVADPGLEVTGHDACPGIESAGDRSTPSCAGIGREG